MLPRRFFLFPVLMLIALSDVSAKTVTYHLADQNGKKQLTFESKAPHDYIIGNAMGINGMISADFEKSDLRLRATVMVPVSRLWTGNKKRDKDLQSEDWLNAMGHPSIRFDLSASDKRSVVKKGRGVWFVKATGSLFIRGVSKFVTVPVRLRQKGNTLHVDGRFTIHPAEYGVYGPMGIKSIGRKISSDVRIQFRLVGKADPSTKKR